VTTFEMLNSKANDIIPTYVLEDVNGLI
jgi:hypothetical protein